MHARLRAAVTLPLLAILLIGQSGVPAHGAGPGNSVYLPYVATIPLVYAADTSVYVDAYGNIQVFGEVINNSGTTLYGSEAE